MVYLLEKTVEITLLYDYYGELLTNRQQEIVNLYYFHDLSLGEISEKLSISRQGVYDHLQRSEKTLNKYEDDLGLVEKHQNFSRKLNELYDYIDKSFSEKEKTGELLKKIAEIQKQI